MSCRQVMECFLDRIGRVNPEVNAICLLRPAEALLREADKADRQIENHQIRLIGGLYPVNRNHRLFGQQDAGGIGLTAGPAHGDQTHLGAPAAGDQGRLDAEVVDAVDDIIEADTGHQAGYNRVRDVFDQLAAADTKGDEAALAAATDDVQGPEPVRHLGNEAVLVEVEQGRRCGCCSAKGKWKPIHHFALSII